MRLLTAHGLVKYKHTMLSAFHDAFPSRTNQANLDTFTTTLKEAVQTNKWGTDYHLFALSLLLDRPIFHYNTLYDHSVPDASTVEEFAQCFHAHGPGTARHCIYCTSLHKVLLSSGGVSNLPLPPIAVFNKQDVHWVAMLPITQSAMNHIPVPFQRLLAD